MDAVKILQKAADTSWDYDDEADVLYISVGQPQPALGIDIGDGVILRYSETQNAVVGLTIIGLRTRLQREQDLVSTASNDDDRNQNLLQAAEAIETLLNQLSQNHSSAAIVGAKAIEEIDRNPILKQKMIGAAQESGTTALEKAVDHPAIRIVIAAIKGFIAD